MRTLGGKVKPMRMTITQYTTRAVASTRQVIVRLARSETGATSIEYGLIIGLIAVVCITAFNLLGNSNSAGWGKMANTAIAAMSK